MSNDIYQVGNLVQVTSYGPFRRLRGTIQKVDTITDDLEDPFCFYLVALEGPTFQVPIWFEYHEVEFIGFRVDVSRSPTMLTGVGLMSDQVGKGQSPK